MKRKIVYGLLALLISFGLWMYVVTVVNPGWEETFYNIPVVLENEEIPGWLSMPKAGATTIWESWEGPNAKGDGAGSLNHYSKGAVCQWLFESMCGINIAGENEFLIAPKPGGHFTFAKAEYNSVYGKISSGWKKQEDGTYSYEISIPANTIANVVLPDGREQICESGHYEFL